MTALFFLKQIIFSKLTAIVLTGITLSLGTVFVYKFLQGHFNSEVVIKEQAGVIKRQNKSIEFTNQAHKNYERLKHCKDKKCREQILIDFGNEDK